MDFGTYLKSLLDEKNINISRLSVQIGIKSKNTFYRLFDNYYSYDKAKEITDKLLSAVNFSNTERTKLYELMNMCRIKKNTLHACRLLEKLYLPPAPAPEAIFRGGESAWLRSDCREIHLYLGYTDTECAVNAARDILSRSTAECKTIKHFADFSKNDVYIAGTLFSMITLSSYYSYCCTEFDDIDFRDLLGLVRTENGYAMFFVTRDGDYIESTISQELYTYMTDKYNSVNGRDIRFNKGRIKDYTSIIQEFAIIDDSPLYSFEGVFCFADIPFATMYQMLVDSNFLGFSENHPYIQSVVKAARTRFDSHIQSHINRFYVLDEKRIIDFLETGRTIDHFEAFRSLTADELREMINHLIENPTYFKYRFFKDGYSKHCIENGIIENKQIFIWDSKSGYGKNHFHISLKNPRAIRLYKDFVDYFWGFCVESEEDSAKRLKHILENTDICSRQ